MNEVMFYSLILSILDSFTKCMHVENVLGNAKICRNFPENTSNRQWHEPYSKIPAFSQP